MLAELAPTRLDAAFFDRSVHEVARELIGCVLLKDGVGGVIVETESYHADDPACHGFGGKTARNRSLFGPPGRAYVYRSYGIHNLLNLVAEPEGAAAAVLLRALDPSHGVDRMAARRGIAEPTRLCSGPGNLGQALAVSLEDDGAPLDQPPFEVLMPAAPFPGRVVAGPRIGITKAADRPWRFCAAANPHVSRPRPVDWL